MLTADAMMRTQTPKHARPPTSILCSNSRIFQEQTCFPALSRSWKFKKPSSRTLQEVFVSMFKHCRLTTGSWKNASGVLESPGSFCNQVSGNPGNSSPNKDQSTERNIAVTIGPLPQRKLRVTSQCSFAKARCTQALARRR